MSNQKIPIRDFKGLMTNIDPSDKPVEYFSKFQNVRVYPGYLKAEGLNFEEKEYALASEEKFIKQQFVYLDDDKFQNKIDANNNKLIGSYTQNIQKYLFRITYDIAEKVYKFRMEGENEGKDGIWDVYGNLPSDDAGQYPQIVNEDGVIKVFFKEKAIWIGRINRKFWNLSDGYETVSSRNFMMFNLMEDFQLNNISSLFNFSAKSSNDPVKINVRGNVIQKVALPSDTVTFDTLGIELEDDKGNKYSYLDSNSGYLPLYKVRNVIPNYPDQEVYAFWTGFQDIEPQPTGYKTSVENPLRRAYYQWKLYNTTGVYEYWQPANPDDVTNFGVKTEDGKYYDWIFFRTMTEVNQWANGNSTNTYPLKFNITSANLDKAFPAGSKTEVLVTIITNGSEYPIDYKTITTPNNDFVIEVGTNGSNITGKYLNKTGINIYMRYGETVGKLSEQDFELAQSFNLVSGISPHPINYINKLTPNGIFLTQTIGKLFDPNTYKIVTNPSRYTNVGGIPYVIHNSNVLYPAVGGGSVLNNFYPENVIPKIEGNLIVSFGNLLGVFSAQKELMTLIDFQPVESQMIFYIKDTLGYKIRDEKDFIETTEGTFIHLREGIYVTNGRERTLISEPINDIIRKYYDTGNIFYNSYLKELYYVSDAGFFCFNFESKVWIEYTSTRFMPSKGVLYIAPTSIAKVPEDVFVSLNEILDVIEDFEGNIYALTQKRAYKISYKTSKGKLKLDYYNLKSYDYSKVLNSIRLDYNGKVDALSTSVASIQRAIGCIYNKLDNRLPYKAVSLDLNFTGILYGLELDLEVSNTEQL